MLQNIIRWEDRYPDVLVLGDSVPRHPRINGHCTSYLPAHHVTTVRGIPVTTAERTLLDLAAVLPEHRLRRAVRQAQYLKLTTVGSLVEVLHGPGPTRGRKKLARILARSAAPTQSELEDVVLDLILRGGFVHPLVNAPLYLAGRRIVPDFRWPEQRLVIEADGPHHDDPLERAADLERQRILEAHGVPRDSCHLGAGDRPSCRHAQAASARPEHRERLIVQAQPEQSTARSTVRPVAIERARVPPTQ